MSGTSYGELNVYSIDFSYISPIDMSDYHSLEYTSFKILNDVYIFYNEIGKVKKHLTKMMCEDLAIHGFAPEFDPFNKLLVIPSNGKYVLIEDNQRYLRPLDLLRESDSLLVKIE